MQNNDTDSFHTAYSRNTARDQVMNNYQNYPQSSWGTKRFELSEEIKNIIYMEHKKYLILSRVRTYSQSEDLILILNMMFLYFHFFRARFS